MKLDNLNQTMLIATNYQAGEMTNFQCKLSRNEKYTTKLMFSNFSAKMMALAWVLIFFFDGDPFTQV